MATATIAPPEKTEASADRLAWRTDRRVVYLLPIASAVLLWAAFPPTGLSGLAWLALVPLFVGATAPVRTRTAFASSWLGGFLFWMMSVSWLHLAEPGWESWLATTAMAATLALWWPAVVGLARRAGRGRIPTLVALPIAWIAGEYAQAFALTGFPWYYLAHSQYRLIPLIQVADLAGAWGVSLLVVVANAALAGLVLDLLHRRRPAILPLAGAAALIAASLVYGVVRLNHDAFGTGPRLALLQANIKQERKNNDPEVVYRTHVRLTAKALDTPERPDLIVWPETSFPYNIVVRDLKLDDAGFARQVAALSPSPDFTPAFWTDRAAGVRDLLKELSDHVKIPMLIGATLYEHGPERLLRSNAAMLIVPGEAGPAPHYKKMHLVPFGEYVPLLETIPAITMLTPYRGGFIPTLDAGTAPAWIEAAGYHMAVAICFEDSFPHVVRRQFAEAPADKVPDVLLNQSNDGWFYGSAEHEMHLAAGLFRAVEHRVPIARAVNTGISALIDGDGRILERIEPTREGILQVVVPTDPRSGLYTVLGDWLPQLCTLSCLLFLLAPLIRPTQNSLP